MRKNKKKIGWGISSKHTRSINTSWLAKKISYFGMIFIKFHNGYDDNLVTSY